MITDQQQGSFRQRGLIRLEGLISESIVSPARDLAFDVLARMGASASQLQVQRELNAQRSVLFDRLVTDEVTEVARQLSGGRELQALAQHPQVLFTPPNAEDWTVPHEHWHSDVPRLGKIGMPGVQLFSFLETAEPGGGGTLVVAGSHRLLNDCGRVRSRNVKRRLRRERWFRDLFEGDPGDRQCLLDQVGRVGDVELQVVELHGAPGDVYLTDLRLLHAPAPNASRASRLMLSQRFFIQSVLGEIVVADGAHSPVR